ncbi:hypothetical protein PIB30_073120, partial [Stylosanthes scabra]|nr:hypothetical protein [Stylosanthes scabra]
MLILPEYVKVVTLRNKKHAGEDMKFWDGGNEGYNEESKKESSSYLYNKVNDSSSSSQSMSMIATNVPNEFRYPISLDLMRDPRLIHTALIPNYALKSLVQQWCHDNNVPVNEPNSSVSEEKSNKRNSNEGAIDHNSANKAAADAVKMTAAFLVGKLATGSAETQRQAAYELRLLAKTGMDNLRIISEVGAIPFLVTLLGSHDPRIQEHAVT